MSVEQQLVILKRGLVDLIQEAELAKKLSLGRPLRVKLGVDPTSADLHFGHLVLFKKLRDFQDLGHHVVLIIGDFTAQIGDPSGQDQTRPVLDSPTITANASTYQTQILRVLDPAKTEFVLNSRWLGELFNATTGNRQATPHQGSGGGFGHWEAPRVFGELFKRYTVQRLLQREDFSKRWKAEQGITLLEVIYPLLQGYDSVAVKADVELGGTDQLFNLLMGRELQRDHGQEPQIVMTLPLLVGIDGVRKMSKSYGNTIAFTDSPDEMFGKVMSLSDPLMWQYYELLTDHDLASVKQQHPREAKAALARELATRFHGQAAAEQAEAAFIRVFTERQAPEQLEEHVASRNPIPLSELLVESGLAPSKKEARRLLQQGGVELDSQTVKSDQDVAINAPVILKVGKRRFRKILRP